MKRKLLGLAAITCIMLIYGSCYKTGEVIYQPVCKPDSLSIPDRMYNFDRNTLGITEANIKFTYDGNRRLISATDYVSGIPFNRFDFMYDGSNNLTQINIWDLRQPLIQNPIRYLSFQYPNGTTNSISKSLTAQYFYLSGNSYIWDGIVYSYTFNTEYQVESIFIGTKPWEKCTYDFGGNLLADSLYGLGGEVQLYYAYGSYDNQINFDRSDRTLQLFLGMYSKNNPGSSSFYQLNAVDNSYYQLQLMSTLTGNYTYNIHGYPTHFMNSFFADYTCLMALPTVPGPLGGGKPVGK